MQQPSTEAAKLQEIAHLHRDLAYPVMGKLAVENDLISKEVLQQAIAEMQQRNHSAPTPVTLEEILLERGYISPASMEKLLASTLRFLDRQFCNTAHKEGLLDQNTCEMVLTAQADAYKDGNLVPVSDILIQQNMLTAEKRDRILSRMRAVAPPLSALTHEEKARPSLAQAWNDQDRKREITAGSRKIPPEEMAIARMALQYRFITTDQLQAAIAQWSADQKHPQPRNLSQILTDLEFINRKEISLLHATRLFHETRQMDQIFGRLCQIHSFCSEADIVRALDTQLAKFKRNRTIKLLGNILVENSILTHEQMVYILREQKRVPPTLEPALQSAQKKSAAAPKETEIAVSISEDELSAHILPAPEIRETLTLRDLKEALMNAGVVFGLRPDNELRSWLETPHLRTEPFEAAKGHPPKEPIDGHIRYGFDPDYLKAGKIDEEGNIDYFDRGEVPFVQKGSHLGQRIPPVNGKPGVKVTGEEAPPREPTDVEIRAGNGVELSLDGQSTHALIDGQPHSTLGGKISVFPEMSIDGDVDLKTGHVSFNGAIRIKGSVQPGFQVKASSASATGINDADVQVEGDLVINGGIIGSRIRAGGMVQAKFVVDSEIIAFGDILVEKEIITSVVRSSSRVVLPKGKLIASEAAARGGIEIYEVGTEVAAPSHIFIGVDFYVQSEITRLRSRTEELKKDLEKTQKTIQGEKKRQEDLHRHIAEKAQIVDKNQNLIQKLSAALPHAGDKAASISQHLLHIRQAIEEAETQTSQLFAQQDQTLDTILKAQRNAELLVGEIEEVRNEYKALLQWSKTNRPKPILKVKGNISSGTRITGGKSQMTLKEKARNMIFTEIQTTDYEGEPSWSIRMQNA
ncbi:FapA family protein [Desulfobotulus sp. H1]|uniref:FapA family protein n=1 Tax=Desulfobotulus pelophilus TaxID=2823377 RepID=A0ABT3N6Q6_9BACT|nr:FapA family protein [Desulfobotulus pelophilus]MCW7753144.1 FapA family protein [Desulfobotulus pelophilus]